MKVPVVWLSYRQPEIIARGTWDTGLLELLLARDIWRPSGALGYSHHEGFEEMPAGADGAVVIIGAQHHHEGKYVARLNNDLERLRWCVVVLAGDECSLFPWNDLDHPAMRLWVMTPRPYLHVACEASFVGEGFHEDTPDVLAKCDVEAMGRPFDWFFAGQITHPRRKQMASALRRYHGSVGHLVETPGFTQGLDRTEYLRRMASAKVVPCPSGPCTPDSFRLYEALEAGALPLADAMTPEGWTGYWPFVYDEMPPFPIVDDWREAPKLIEAALANWPRNANRANAWWQGYKRDLALWLDDDVRALSSREQATENLADLITVIVPTSPVPSHPDTAIIEETIDSVRERLPDAPVFVLCDGVRREQEERRPDYEEYLRRLLWMTNHRWRNVLPIVHDDHLHQAEMLRRALIKVRTPLVLFVEHDTPLCEEIPFADLADAVLSGEADVVRLHHEALVLEPHRYLMAEEGPQQVSGQPLWRTAQWSQRPHIASADWYRKMLDDYFAAYARTMIEDRFYSEVSTPWVERREWGKVCRLWLYAPPDDMKRSLHLDGRAGEQKYEMTW